MVYRVGVNWYARLQKQKAELEHKLEDIQAHNKILIQKLKKYEDRTTKKTGTAC